ncbi:MAG: UDP-glucose--hexose-1-phosphate uridylyltransferase [Acidobacteriota bacterium]|nr:MAG: UDP-glucose--hexose-1-phosphate uridylyltransferase [Acidobacteriota bacterium]
MSHRRYNPLLDEWVLCSPGRLKRPWLGQTDTPNPGSATRPAYDPACYMCPGNARASGEPNPDYESVFLFDNDYPALTAPKSIDDSTGDTKPDTSRPLLIAAPERGRCRVVCFSPRHDMHLGVMTPSAVRQVVDAWAAESERLATDEDTSYVQIFENRGLMMGASNPHPHGQIWASEHVPTIPARKAQRQDNYWTQHGSDLLGDYLDEELRRDERVIESNDHWIHLVPFWAVWPFETMLVPRRHVGEVSELDDDERVALAELIGKLTRRYDALFETPFPYSMGWYQRPRDGDARAGSRLHAVYLPPLVRSATVRKFLVGYEMTSEPQRDFTAEQACERLKACPT